MDTQAAAVEGVEVELQQVMAAARDALTDEMIGRLATTASEAADLMDQINRAGLGRAIPALAEMVNNGDLQRLVKLARLYSSAEDALTDEMVGRLTETVGNGLSLLDRFARGGADRVLHILEGLESCGALQQLAAAIPKLTERMARIQAMLGAIEAASAATRQLPPSRGGVGGLWQLMRDPDTQDTLRFLLTVGKGLRSGMLPLTGESTPAR
jgi:Asp-tRNA(Asn)/Glu-tRNA(Gln) amidotransferase C subunit